ncbi:MAG: methyl-accepting chemotaxis protein [Sulfurimonas sp.]|nr:methyl-accepting chemotaxis protein [Sulfurimonas sp.]
MSNQAEELKYSTDTMKSAEDIALSADTISASMDEIQNALEDVTGALNQMEESSQNTNQSALNNKELIESGLGVAKDIDKLIEIARRNFDLLKISFNEVKASVIEIKASFSDSIKEGNSAATELNVIVKETKSVDKTVGNISNSIVQLNMLAISGSIEAARAGDFGKGFAVVSSDIRNLAKDSESNTEKINDIVESMNSEIDTVKSDWGELLNSQATEEDSISSVVNDIIGITDILVDLLDKYTGLKSANDQNLEGMNQVMIGISEIQKAVELEC